MEKRVEILKLYRHHTPSFQAQIENGDGFVIDESRRFNFNRKNYAQFFFYSTTIRGAEFYAVEDRDFYGREATRLYVYEAKVKLLDLTTVEGRKKMPVSILQMLADKDNEVKKLVLEDLKRAGVNPSVISTKSNSLLKETTLEDVINDNPYNGLTFWGQNLTDYENGLALKDAIVELGLDGVIIDAGTIHGKDVALLSPAKQID